MSNTESDTEDRYIEGCFVACFVDVDGYAPEEDYCDIDLHHTPQPIKTLHALHTTARPSTFKYRRFRHIEGCLIACTVDVESWIDMHQKRIIVNNCIISHTPTIRAPRSSLTKKRALNRENPMQQVPEEEKGNDSYRGREQECRGKRVVSIWHPVRRGRRRGTNRGL